MGDKKRICLVFCVVSFLLSFVTAAAVLAVALSKSPAGERLIDIFELVVTACAAGATGWLGYVANRQNRVLIKMQETESNITRSSCVSLEKESGRDYTELSNENGSYGNAWDRCLYLNVHNCGKAMLKKIRLFFGDKAFESHLAIADGEEKSVQIPLPSNVDDGDMVDVEYVSCYDVITHGRFILEKINDDAYECERAYERKYYHYEGLKEETKK